jgi:hypothetical protein
MLEAGFAGLESYQPRFECDEARGISLWMVWTFRDLDCPEVT